ncbi:hypothetical protein ACHAWF_005902 [Thalassiosira exigua]
MKAHPNRADSASEPLLASSSSSSSYHDGTSAPPRGPLTVKAILSPLISSALACHAPGGGAADASSSAALDRSICSTVPSFDSASNSSPARAKKEPPPLPTSVGAPAAMARREANKEANYEATASAEGKAPAAAVGGGREDKSRRRRRDIVSPTAIALGRRSRTLPASARSSLSLPDLPELRDAHFDAPSVGSVDSDDLALRKSRGESIAFSPYRHLSHDCNYRHALERAYEDFGVERKLVVLNQKKQQRPRKSDGNGEKRARARANTCPEAAAATTPVRGSKSRPGSRSTSARRSESASAPGGRPPRHVLCQMGMAPPQTGIASEKATSRSAPATAKGAELCKLNRDRADPERLLSEMGMNVTSDDYCIEGEFAVRKDPRRRSSPPRERDCDRPSHDCDCNAPPEPACEDFGVERKPVRSKHPIREGTRRASVRRVRSLVRSGLAALGGHATDDSNAAHHRGHVVQGRPPRDATLKAKVLSLVRGTRSGVPDHIVAPLTPTSSEDDCAESPATPSPEEGAREEEPPMTPDDLRLLYRWQVARVRGADREAGAEEARPAPRTRSALPEDVLSVASSCGDRTAPVDNRRRRRLGTI